MNIFLAQINSTLGNFEFNSQKILDYTKEAKKKQADLIVFPELCLLGYPPLDLLERTEVLKQQKKALTKLVKTLPKNIGVLFGCLIEKKGLLYNGAHFVFNNSIQKTFKKSLLPNYDVFDESRFFSPGSLSENILKFKNEKFLITLCEDIWCFEKKEKYAQNPYTKIKNINAIISLNGSPFDLDKKKKRLDIAKFFTKKFNCPFYYVNSVGAQDELIFDGGSFALDSKGNTLLTAPFFTEELIGVNKKTPAPTRESLIFKALCTGIENYVTKNGFTKVHLGLSGGIDSGLVAALACYALGPDKVTCIALPGPHSSKLSFDLAKKLCRNLNCTLIDFNINNSYTEFLSTFEKTFGKMDFGIMNENAQARLRALYLMAYSNSSNSLLLATSNKSELAVGYSTLYGDQCGALMPIGDLLKTQVFSLSNWINKKFKTPLGKEIIPRKMIERPPSAELRPDQKDSDSLPDYKLLDKSIEKVITKQKTATSELDKWVLQKSFASEFKRWQAPPILKISPHAFGRGRRMPLSHQLISGTDTKSRN